MVEELTLFNFQKHKKRTFQFSSSITTVQGRTDKGKSSIIRALRWVLLNDFTGNFIRDGTKNCAVRVYIDGQKILRGKGSKGNKYKLGKSVFKSFNNTVPDSIKNFLQVSDINFQNQHDAPFWFSETAGEVSRQLNSVIDLSIIDSSLSFIASEVRTAQQRKAIVEERLKGLKDELEELKLTKERIKEFDELKKTQSRFDELKDNSSELEAVLDVAHSYQIRTLAQQARDSENVCRFANRVRRFAKSYHLLSEIVEEAGKQKALISNVPDLQPLISGCEQMQSIAEKCNSLARLAQRAADGALAANALEQASKAAEKRFKRVLKNLTCPLCGRSR